MNENSMRVNGREKMLVSPHEVFRGWFQKVLNMPRQGRRLAGIWQSSGPVRTTKARTTGEMAIHGSLLIISSRNPPFQNPIHSSIHLFKQIVPLRAPPLSMICIQANKSRTLHHHSPSLSPFNRAMPSFAASGMLGSTLELGKLERTADDEKEIGRSTVWLESLQLVP